MSTRDWVGAGTRERVLTLRPTLGLSISTKWAQRLGGDTSQDVMQGQREHGRGRQHAWSKDGTGRSEMEGRPQRDASTSGQFRSKVCRAKGESDWVSSGWNPVGRKGGSGT